jgi:long-chain fatty acid transport protein
MLLRMVICTVVLASSSLAFANGFILNDHGARATGRADAVAATVRNGSAIVYNPAGIAVEDGLQLSLGTSLIFPQSSFTEARTGQITETEGNVGVTPTLFINAKLAGVVALGLGVHAPFGNKVEWPADSPGADVSRVTNLRTLFLTPAIAFDVGGGVTLGGGVDIVPASVELGRDIFFGAETGSVRLAGSALGFGARAGVMWTPRFLPDVSVGASYRSRVKLKFHGTGDFDAPEPFRPQLPADGDISAKASLPDSALFGVAVRPLPGLELEGNLQWMGWSAFDRIEVQLPGTTMSDPRHYRDTMTWRAGAEYQFRPLALDVRAGYAYDPTPIPENHLTVALPDIDRHVVSAGLSYHVPPAILGLQRLTDLSIDFGVLWVLPGEKRTAEMSGPQLQGEFQVEALVTAISLGARFGGGSNLP